MIILLSVCQEPMKGIFLSLSVGLTWRNGHNTMKWSMNFKCFYAVLLMALRLYNYVRSLFNYLWFIDREDSLLWYFVTNWYRVWLKSWEMLHLIEQQHWFLFTYAFMTHIDSQRHDNSKRILMMVNQTTVTIAKAIGFPMYNVFTYRHTANYHTKV